MVPWRCRLEWQNKRRRPATHYRALARGGAGFPAYWPLARTGRFSLPQSYSNRFQVDPTATSFVTNTYDATYALALAAAGIPKGTRVDGANLSAALARMSAPDGVAIEVGTNGFIKGANALANGQTINLTGASGPLKWDANGDLTDAPIEVWGISIEAKTFCTYNAALTMCQ